MKVLLDTNVLFPTVLREVLLGVAAEGMYTPLWSDRILEEWARAAARHGPEHEAIARADIAKVSAGWPTASVRPRDRDLQRLVLPDENDVHVLAAAIAVSADILVTANARDFPRHALNAEGVSRQDPDAFLRALWAEDAALVEVAVQRVVEEAERLSGQPQPTRALLKRARLPRLAKAVG